ncbi:hypothetical protein ACNOYE_07385 [Nannocystaceae bacterium ST9]
MAKVGIGAGVAVGAGLLGVGVYQLGKRLGWWGASSGGIVIDDLPKPDGGGGGGTPDVKPDGGGGAKGKRASGKPPNASNDPAGYDTALYPSPAPVRLGFKLLGYAITYGSEGLNPDSKPHPEVTKFQREWNRVIQGIDAGSVDLPASPSQPVWIDRLRGLLDTDGIAGKNTLNALEIAVANHSRNLNWREAVKQAGAGA